MVAASTCKRVRKGKLQCDDSTIGIFSANKNIPLQNTSGLTVVCTLNPLGARAYFSAATNFSTDNITVSDIYVTATCMIRAV